MDDPNIEFLKIVLFEYSDVQFKNAPNVECDKIKP
jgi:hypothetical protein